MLCCACRRAARVAMCSVLCPPLSACGMRMRKSEPAACPTLLESENGIVSRPQIYEITIAKFDPL
eukprot:926148-Prymnesium_polylepis.1